jgi:integrase
VIPGRPTQTRAACGPRLHGARDLVDNDHSRRYADDRSRGSHWERCGRRTSRLTAAQPQTLPDAIRGDRLETSSRVMPATGLRRGEALALLGSDVDVDAGLL